MTDIIEIALPATPDVPPRWLARRDGVLHGESVALSDIARTVGTPFYCYSASTLRQAYAALSEAIAPLGASVCFAVKANGNLSVLKEFAQLGCGMDIVSGGELTRALAAGVPASRIIFSGVGKTRAEIRQALAAGLHQINVESPAELEAVASVAREMGVRAPVALRVNPDVDAMTHAKITTAKKDSKFGIAIADIPALYAAASSRAELHMVGLAVHIGSQILDLSPFRDAWTVMAELVRDLRSRGLSVERLDLGGGLGIGDDVRDGPDLAEYAAIIEQTVAGLGCALKVEPGRWLVGRAGALVTEVLYVKDGAGVSIVVVDAAMNDLMRPALYDARHPALTVHDPRADADARPSLLVGPICESSDVFGKYQTLGRIQSGDLVVFDNAGAYGASMSSTYNARDMVPEVLIDGEAFRLIRRRVGIADALAHEQAGPWQSTTQTG